METIYFLIQEYNKVEIPVLMNSITGELEYSSESIKRTDVVRNTISKFNGVELGKVLPNNDFDRILHEIHDPDYIHYVMSNSLKLKENEYILEQKYSPGYVENDTPIVTETYRQAYSAGLTAYCAGNALSGNRRFCYAAVRPPGHHAGKAFMGGYCYFNNAVVAAYAILEGGCRKVGILDLDFHMGNGTFDLVAGDPRIQFASIHGSTLTNYPYHEFVQRNDAVILEDFEVNPAEESYLSKLQKVINKMDSCEKIVISLGYDILQNDPHGKWNLPPKILYQIGHLLKNSGKKLCFIQEGGYNIDNITSGLEYLIVSLTQ